MEGKLAANPSAPLNLEYFNLKTTPKIVKALIFNF